MLVIKLELLVFPSRSNHSLKQITTTHSFSMGRIFWKHTQSSISVLKHCRIHLNLIIYQIQDYQIQTDYLPLHSVRHHCRHIQRKDQKCHSETLCPSFLSVLLQLLSHFYRPDANIIKTYTKITANLHFKSQAPIRCSFCFPINIRIEVNGC